MRWKFWGKKPRTSRFNSPVVDVIPMASLFRWYCYDLDVDDVHDLSLKLGMTPISKEAEEFELKASNERMEEVRSLFHFLDAVAQINTNVMVESNREMVQGMPLDDEQKEKLMAMFTANFYVISISAVVSAFSSALALDLVHKGPIVAAGIGGLGE